MNRVRPHLPSPAMVVALAALFVALGGSAYAVVSLPRNSVDTAQLRAGAVTAGKLRAGAVTSSKVKRHSLLAKDFKAGQLPPGSQGAQGPQGAQGLPGPQGPPGPATGPAGGDLTGSYPDPSIAPGAVTNAQLANPALSITPGTGLTGGGPIALGGSGALGIADFGIGNGQLSLEHPVTTGKFAPDAQAPDSDRLGGRAPSEYGGVLSGRINGFRANDSRWFGAVSGTSTASTDQAPVTTLSPDHDFFARDLSVQITASPGGTTLDFILLVNGTDSGLRCRIEDPATTCTTTDLYEGGVPANSTLSIEVDTLVFAPPVPPVPIDATFAFLTEVNR